MDNNELTFTDMWYRYIVPFFIGIGRSIKRTVCSKRIIAVVLFMVFVPVAAFAVFKLSNKEAEKLYFDVSSYMVGIDEEKIDMTYVIVNENESKCKQSVALEVAMQQAEVIADVIKSEQFLKTLYNDENVMNGCACLINGLSDKFCKLYIGDKINEDGKISEGYFCWAIKDYICVDVDENGLFSVNVVNNIPAWYKYKVATMEGDNKIVSNQYNNAIKQYKDYPVLDNALISAVGNVIESIVPNALYDYMFNVRKVNSMTGITNVTANATQTMSEDMSTFKTSFVISDWVKYAFIGVVISMIFFQIVDMCKSIGDGLKRYREKN